MLTLYIEDAYAYSKENEENQQEKNERRGRLLSNAMIQFHSHPLLREIRNWKFVSHASMQRLKRMHLH